MKTFASFSIIFNNDKICATTRPDGSIGLPGGKVDLGETSENACIRETEEEGWKLPTNYEIIKVITQIIDNKPIDYYLIFSKENATKLENYKEKYRGITPIYFPEDKIENDVLGNKLAIKLALNIKNYLYES